MDEIAVDGHHDQAPFRAYIRHVSLLTASTAANLSAVACVLHWCFRLIDNRNRDTDSVTTKVLAVVHEPSRRLIPSGLLDNVAHVHIAYERYNLNQTGSSYKALSQIPK